MDGGHTPSGEALPPFISRRLHPPGTPVADDREAPWNVDKTHVIMAVVEKVREAGETSKVVVREVAESAKGTYSRLLLSDVVLYYFD